MVRIHPPARSQQRTLWLPGASHAGWDPEFESALLQRGVSNEPCGCRRKGTTLTKEMFLNHLYGGMDEPELKIIDVFVCKLRKKLADATGGSHYIETVWGRGYVLRDPLPMAGSWPIGI